jgi:hypothetical protein
MAANIATIWHRALAAAGREHHRIGASLFRVGAGLTILFQYLITYYDRRFLYGPDGVIAHAHFVQYLRETGAFSLYALDPSPLVFEALFHLGIAVTALWVLGWHTRAMTFLTWIFLWSLHQRNPALWDGGDNLVQIVLIYALFADLGAVCSADAALADRRGGRGGPVRWIRALLHNAALLAIALQLCLVYSTAGLYKVQGELWQNGTALYYILRSGDFAWTGFGRLICEHTLVGALLTYGTVVFQLSFPFLFCAHRATRRLTLVAGILFHLGVGLTMGLTSFSALLVSVELLFVPDRDYRRALRACRRLWQGLGAGEARAYR